MGDEIKVYCTPQAMGTYRLPPIIAKFDKNNNGRIDQPEVTEKFAKSLKPINDTDSFRRVICNSTQKVRSKIITRLKKLGFGQTLTNLESALSFPVDKTLKKLTSIYTGNTFTSLPSPTNTGYNFLFVKHALIFDEKSRTERITYVYKIHGSNPLSKEEFYFNPCGAMYASLKVKKKNGKIKDLSQTNISIKTNPDAKRSREGVLEVKFPSLSKGDIVEVTIERKKKLLPHEKGVIDNVFFIEEWDTGIFRRVVEVSAPVSYKAPDTHIFENGKKVSKFPFLEKKSYKKNDGRWKIHLEFKKTPPMPLTHLIAAEDALSHFILANHKNWRTFLTPVFKGFKRAIELDPSVKTKVKKITKGKKTQKDKAKAIFQWVQNIPNVEISRPLLPAKASSTIRNNGGDCKDKGALLVAMLKAIGIKADPVLLEEDLSPIYNKDIYARDIVSQQQLPHLIVKAEIDGKKYWLDPTVPHASFTKTPQDLKGWDGLVIELDGADLYYYWEVIK